MLTVPMFVNVVTKADEPPTEPPTEEDWEVGNSSGTPPLPSWFPKEIPLTKDADGNRVSGSLDEIILEATESGTLSTIIPIDMVPENNELVTAEGVAYFEEFGGRSTSPAGEVTFFWRNCNWKYPMILSLATVT